jgi:SAM-dependent methyltransferase
MAAIGPSVNKTARDPEHPVPIHLPFRCRLALHRVHERSVAARQVRGRVAELVARDRVLEVGSGYGDNADACATGYLGVDTTAAVVVEARRRHPDREFLIWDLARQGAVPGEFDAALLCLAVHELTDRDRVVKVAADQARSRIVVVDYDPLIRGWARWREEALEKGKLRRYLRFDLGAFLSARGWVEAGSRPLGEVYRSWVFVPAGC